MNDITERRCTNLLCEYWDEIRGNRHHPDLADIHQEQLTDIWEDCFIVKYLGGQYEIKHIGEAIKEAYESDLNIAIDAPLIQFNNLDNIKDYLDEVIENTEAIIEESECDDLDGNTIKFRQCFLPLGPNDHTVNAIIGALRYKIYS